MALTDGENVGRGLDTAAGHLDVQCRSARLRSHWARGRRQLDPAAGSRLTRQELAVSTIHGRPAARASGRGTYGKVSDRRRSKHDAVVFVPTNDGYPACDQRRTIAKGWPELWAFMPAGAAPALGQRIASRRPRGRCARYGLDGDVRVLEARRRTRTASSMRDGDRVYLFFGMRTRRQPLLRARRHRSRPTRSCCGTSARTSLPGLGQTWSPPVVTRVNVQTTAIDGHREVRADLRRRLRPG